MRTASRVAICLALGCATTPAFAQNDAGVAEAGLGNEDSGDSGDSRADGGADGGVDAPDALIADTGYLCDPNACSGGNCRCASVDSPGGIPAENLPQFIVLTMDDAVTEQIRTSVEDVIRGIENPNRCPVPYTHFVSVTNSDPKSACALYRDGREVANHTVDHDTSHSTPVEEWRRQITGAQVWFNNAGIDPSAVRGFRAPFLEYNRELGGVLRELGFDYDSSVGEAISAPLSSGIDSFIWPYTLHAGYAQHCWTGPTPPTCPTINVPDLWEIPVWTVLDPATNVEYTMDPLPPAGAEERSWVRSVLRANLDARMAGNRAPLGIFLHPGWLMGSPDRSSGLRAFLEEARTSNDVWIVKMSTLVDYMRVPRTSEEMLNWEGVACPPVNVDCDNPRPLDGGVVGIDTGRHVPDTGPRADTGRVSVQRDSGRVSGGADAGPIRGNFEVVDATDAPCGCRTSSRHPADPTWLWSILALLLLRARRP